MKLVHSYGGGVGGGGDGGGGGGGLGGDGGGGEQKNLGVDEHAVSAGSDGSTHIRKPPSPAA